MESLKWLIRSKVKMILIIYVVLSLLIGCFGVKKKLGFWGYFFGSLALTPAVGIILLLASDRCKPK
ncbi:MAG TPA: hypothetical protein EYG48_02965 [Methylococcales bacterium]|nr:hypothetical protein [Methylococcales bacterium]